MLKHLKSQNLKPNWGKILILLAVVILALLLAIILFRDKAAAPHNNAATPQINLPYKDGQTVELEGEVVCLPHRDQSGPMTMECAFGFRDKNGVYYVLRDAEGADPLRIGRLPMNQTMKIKGVYKNGGEQKYQQEGTIELLPSE